MTAVEIDAALEAEYADAERFDADAREARIAALLEQKSEAERAESEAREEAAADLKSIEADYLAARQRVYATLSPYVDAREAATALRLQYEAAWTAAQKLGVEATRLEPSVFPDEIRYRLQALSGRW